MILLHTNSICRFMLQQVLKRGFSIKFYSTFGIKLLYEDIKALTYHKIQILIQNLVQTT